VGSIYSSCVFSCCAERRRRREGESICAADGERALGTRWTAVLERAIFNQQAGRGGGGEGRIGVSDGGFGELNCNYN